VTALRDVDGAILGVEQSGRAARFDTAGSFTETVQLPFFSIQDVYPRDDSTAFVVGARTDSTSSERVHLWSLRSKRVLQSFFRPPVPAPTTVVVSRRATLVLNAFIDSVYVFGAKGRLTRTLALPADNFRPFTPAPNGGLPDFNSFSVVYQGAALSDGSVLVQYFDYDENGDPAFRLVHMSESGEKRFELMDTPQLLGIAPDARTLLFVARGAEAPNVWRTARIRSVD
jgi:hypothetical protein